MSNLNSWEDDPSAQDENLSRQAQQQLNMNPQAQGGFHPGASSFQPGAASFQPGQYGGGGFQPQFQQQQYYQQGLYNQYGGQPQQNFGQYGQQYGGGFSQGYNQQGYGKMNVETRLKENLTINRWRIPSVRPDTATAATRAIPTTCPRQRAHDREATR